jgi:hypothetical protein
MNVRYSVGRFSRRLGIASLLLGLVILGSGKIAFGQLPGTPLPGNPGFILEFDEAGHGRVITDAGAIDDPGVPQLGGGILYDLPVPVFGGDVIVINTLDISAANPDGYSDLLTFEGHTLLYRSLLDESEPFPDPADVAGLIFPATSFSTFESGPEGFNGFVWILDSGLPSYTVYNGISDIPEPSTFILGGLGLIALLLVGRRRRVAV